MNKKWGNKIPHKINLLLTNYCIMKLQIFLACLFLYCLLVYRLYNDADFEKEIKKRYPIYKQDSRILLKFAYFPVIVSGKKIVFLNFYRVFQRKVMNRKGKNVWISTDKWK